MKEIECNSITILFIINTIIKYTNNSNKFNLHNQALELNYYLVEI